MIISHYNVRNDFLALWIKHLLSNKMNYYYYNILECTCILQFFLYSHCVHVLNFKSCHPCSYVLRIWSWEFLVIIVRSFMYICLYLWWFNNLTFLKQMSALHCGGDVGTFTLSNLGMFGVDRFDAILPPGTVSIQFLWRSLLLVSRSEAW